MRSCQGLTLASYAIARWLHRFELPRPRQVRCPDLKQKRGDEARCGGVGKVRAATPHGAGRSLADVAVRAACIVFRRVWGGCPIGTRRDLNFAGQRSEFLAHSPPRPGPAPLHARRWGRRAAGANAVHRLWFASCADLLLRFANVACARSSMTQRARGSGSLPDLAFRVRRRCARGSLFRRLSWSPVVSFRQARRRPSSVQHRPPEGKNFRFSFFAFAAALTLRSISVSTASGKLGCLRVSGLLTGHI